MFTRPEDLAEGKIRAELAAGWNFAAETLSYLPVGFGSHHWRATDAVGHQLFLLVHDLPHMLDSRLDTLQAAFGRLETAFGCALSLRRNAGLEFVIAPVPTGSGQIVCRLSERYSLAACPYLTESETGLDSDFQAADRPAVVRLLTELHQATPAVAPLPCDFRLQNADGLRAAIESTGEPWHTGPYGERARALLAPHAAGVIALMTAYRELAAGARSRPERFVVTHGEPNAENVLKTPAGFVIVDWDFVQLAPPERDLWDLAEADRAVLAAYTEATGTDIDSGALALFRMWYDLSEIAGYLKLFRAAHDDTEDTAESWQNLEQFLRPAERWPQLRLPAPDGMRGLPGPRLGGPAAIPRRVVRVSATDGLAVQQMWRYPVKSLGGEPVEASWADERGLAGPDPATRRIPVRDCAAGACVRKRAAWPPACAPWPHGWAWWGAGAAVARRSPR